MANTLRCDIVTPAQTIFKGEAVIVRAPASEGDIGMMYQCSPLMSTLRRGTICIKGEDNSDTTFAVEGGYLEVDGYKVIILANRAVDLSLIDKEHAGQIIAKNEKQLSELEEGDPKRAYAEEELSWQQYLLTFL